MTSDLQNYWDQWNPSQALRTCARSTSRRPSTIPGPGSTAPAS
jgi:hypothetical protein